MLRPLLTLMISVIALSGNAVQATIIEYSDRSAFEAALTSFTTQDFESLLGVGDFNSGIVDVGDFTVGSAYSLGGAAGNFVTSSPDGAIDFNGSVFGRAAVLRDLPLSVDFDFEIFAFGVELDEFGDVSGSSTINILGHQLDTGGPSVGTDSDPYFFGVISSIGFSNVSFSTQRDPSSGSGDGFGFDNFTYSTELVTSVPAPITLYLFMQGVILLMVGKRLNKY